MATIEEIREHTGQTFADRHPDLRGQSCWCVDCGEPAAAEALTWWQACARCAQWWRDNPPPGP